MKCYFEKGLLEERWITGYCKGNWQNCIRYQMEEKGEYHPDNMLPDGSINNQLK
jgi:DNA polymerase